MLSSESIQSIQRHMLNDVLSPYTITQKLNATDNISDGGWIVEPGEIEQPDESSLGYNICLVIPKSRDLTESTAHALRISQRFKDHVQHWQTLNASDAPPSEITIRGASYYKIPLYHINERFWVRFCQASSLEKPNSPRAEFIEDENAKKMQLVYAALVRLTFLFVHQQFLSASPDVKKAILGFLNYRETRNLPVITENADIKRLHTACGYVYSGFIDMLVKMPATEFTIGLKKLLAHPNLNKELKETLSAVNIDSRHLGQYLSEIKNSFLFQISPNALITKFDIMERLEKNTLTATSPQPSNNISITAEMEFLDLVLQQANDILKQNNSFPIDHAFVAPLLKLATSSDIPQEQKTYLLSNMRHSLNFYFYNHVLENGLIRAITADFSDYLKKNNISADAAAQASAGILWIFPAMEEKEQQYFQTFQQPSQLKRSTILHPDSPILAKNSSKDELIDQNQQGTHRPGPSKTGYG